MRRALELGRDAAGDFVYFVEDDYLHEQSALLEMYRSYRIFARNLGRSNIGLFPVDQHEYYLPHAIHPSRIVPGSARHWRTNTHTTSTFFVPYSLLTTQWEWFIKNPESEHTSPIGMTEEGSINVVWQEHATLFTPIPTLAYHVHGESQMPPFSTWEKLWDSLETFEL